MISGYIKKAFLYAIFFSIVYVIGRAAYIRKKQITIHMVHEIGLGLFWVYIFVLFSQTVFPLWQCGFCEGRFYIQITRYANGSVNLIPFKTISMYLFGKSASSEWSSISLLNIAANIGLFVPVGILLPLAYRTNLGTTIVTGCFLSVFIEVMQLAVGRSSDIDDVILNALGAMIGFLFYKLLIRENPLLRKK